jgi:hypothetical protein
MNPDAVQQELQDLRKTVRNLSTLVAALLLTAAACFLLGATKGPQVLRLKGLVIVDDQGRDRILLGAPTPESASRTRKDAQTESLVFLGENGADRVIIGQTPDPSIAGQTSKRIAEGWGSLYFDPNGNERGGMGFLGNGRAVVALDRPNGDALGMMVDDQTHYAGMLINYPSRQAALELSVEDTQPSIEIFDPNGKGRAKLKLSGADRPTWELHDEATASKEPE